MAGPVDSASLLSLFLGCPSHFPPTMQGRWKHAILSMHSLTRIATGSHWSKSASCQKNLRPFLPPFLDLSTRQFLEGWMEFRALSELSDLHSRAFAAVDRELKHRRTSPGLDVLPPLASSAPEAASLALLSRLLATHPSLLTKACRDAPRSEETPPALSLARMQFATGLVHSLVPLREHSSFRQEIEQAIAADHRHAWRTAFAKALAAKYDVPALLTACRS
eukprot:6325941-Amphidinium_carterae.1